MITIKIIIFSDETRNEKNCEIQDQVGPGPERFKKSRTDSDQDQIFPRKSRTENRPVRGSLVMATFDKKAFSRKWPL